MAASDNLGGQFDREANRRTIPQHHHDAIRAAISHMGERGIELVPGGIHVTPSDGGKSHFIPHSHPELRVLPDNEWRAYRLEAGVPTEAHPVDYELVMNRNNKLSINHSLGVHSLDHGLRTSRREDFHDPANPKHLEHPMDRDYDPIVPYTKDTTRTGHTDKGALKYDRATNDFSSPSYDTLAQDDYPNSDETLGLLPHLGGNPKTPAHFLGQDIGPRGGHLTSEEIEAPKGLYHAWSHVYNPRIPPRVDARINDAGPARFRDRHNINVTVRENRTDTLYHYDTATGQIRPREV